LGEKKETDIFQGVAGSTTKVGVGWGNFWWENKASFKV
jgi:hypothetical protein